MGAASVQQDTHFRTNPTGIGMYLYTQANGGARSVVVEADERVPHLEVPQEVGVAVACAANDKEYSTRPTESALRPRGAPSTQLAVAQARDRIEGSNTARPSGEPQPSMALPE